jgi:hypothetical protein
MLFKKNLILIVFFFIYSESFSKNQKTSYKKIWIPVVCAASFSTAFLLYQNHSDKKKKIKNNSKKRKTQVRLLNPNKTTKNINLYQYNDEITLEKEPFSLLKKKKIFYGQSHNNGHNNQDNLKKQQEQNTNFFKNIFKNFNNTFQRSRKKQYQDQTYSSNYPKDQSHFFHEQQKSNHFHENVNFKPSGQEFKENINKNYRQSLMEVESLKISQVFQDKKTVGIKQNGDYSIKDCSKILFNMNYNHKNNNSIITFYLFKNDVTLRGKSIEKNLWDKESFLKIEFTIDLTNKTFTLKEGPSNGVLNPIVSTPLKLNRMSLYLHPDKNRYIFDGENYSNNLFQLMTPLIIK